jgi:hypothetical protein
MSKLLYKIQQPHVNYNMYLRLSTFRIIAANLNKNIPGWGRKANAVASVKMKPGAMMP